MSTAASSLADRYLGLLTAALTHTLYRDVDRIEPPERVKEAFAQVIADSDDAWALVDHERSRERRPRLAAVRADDGRPQAARQRARCVETRARRRRARRPDRDRRVARRRVDLHARRPRGLRRHRPHGVGRPTRSRACRRRTPSATPPTPASQLHTAEPLAVVASTRSSTTSSATGCSTTGRFLEGWFKDTLPTVARSDMVASIRLDGDMYESTMDGARRTSTRSSRPAASSSSTTTAVDAVPAGGRTTTATAHGIDEPIEQIDWTSGPTGASPPERGSASRLVPFGPDDLQELQAFDRGEQTRRT